MEDWKKEEHSSCMIVVSLGYKVVPVRTDIRAMTAVTYAATVQLVVC